MKSHVGIENKVRLGVTVVIRCLTDGFTGMMSPVETKLVCCSCLQKGCLLSFLVVKIACLNLNTFNMDHP